MDRARWSDAVSIVVEFMGVPPPMKRLGRGFIRLESALNTIVPPVPPPPPPPLPAASIAPVVLGSPSEVDFGQDFSHLSMLDPNLTLIGGFANLGQALAHRLQTPQGTLFYDRNYGRDIRSYLNDSLDAGKIAKCRAEVESQALEDERITAATSTVVFDQGTSALTISLAVMTSFGPFLLVLSVTAVTVTLLSASRQT
jgi:phage baseplate assembly protein W